MINIQQCSDSGISSTTVSTHKRHPISDPHKRAMGCALWGFREYSWCFNSTILYILSVDDNTYSTTILLTDLNFSDKIFKTSTCMIRSRTSLKSRTRFKKNFWLQSMIWGSKSVVALYCMRKGLLVHVVIKNDVIVIDELIGPTGPGRFQFNFRLVIFKLTLVNGCRGISYEIPLRWMPLDLTDDKSILVQVLAWWRQATSHYLSQCCPSSMSPYGITRPQWLNA